MTAPKREREREREASADMSLDDFLAGAADAGPVARVHLLDCGPEEYGDALLIELGDETILIDGAHPGNNREKDGHPALQDQIASLLGRELPIQVSLLIVSHAHEDHIGCLPALVRDGHITAEFALVADPDLAWGREPDAPPPRLDDRAAMIVAGLREEPRSPNTPDAELQQFLLDAMNLEGRYRAMLDTLEQTGTVVRYGRKAGYTKLKKRFANIGLEILGPSEEQLLIAADLIATRTSDAIDAISDQLALDADPVEVYRQLVSLDAADGKSRPGEAVNLQSIVTRFTAGGKRFLFAGDMQFAAPGVSNDRVEENIRKLREKIAEGAPYAFAKLSHHGSDNAFDEDVLDELGKTRYLGICAGSGSTKHPHHDVLDLLKKHSSQLTWVRTDRNGQCTLTFGAQTRVELTEGKKNDARPNSEDIGREAAPPETPAWPIVPPGPENEPAVVQEVAADGSVEVFARVPHTRTKVTLTIDVEPYGNAARADRGAVRRVSTLPHNWRPSAAVSKLLFVTSRPALERNVGASETELILSSLARAGAEVIDFAVAPRDTLRQRIASRPRGVVILGGYDVVPSQRIDCLPPQLRERLGNTEDPDDFVVWSDDVYGDEDGDGLPEVPVSRIPDGHTAAVLFGAIAAPAAAQPTRAGVRNTARPFAKQIFASLPGTGDIRASQPQCFDNPAFTLDGHHVYLMLHGDYTDGSRFWGEGTLNNAEAMNVSNIPDPAPAVVFTGCCWGALTVDKPAGRWTNGQSLGIKAPDSSIALTFLARGARAYIGCTGAHYSPTTEPYDYFGGPMHAAFWRAYRSGKSPAQALFDAKIEYLAGMPHHQRTDIGQAIEFKILRQYTCLGLGW
ncbi:MAG TPA: MBL fold metallo-hydrolase [Thermoanaerobaculia bacterium]